ncbi:hypothetical protein GQ53DRAFT_792100 [Thozetella sp. PMI_491]|nr:hypothetical protein GQ53DRAFT_792100 [Thozetella sp. PMI_491]
MLTFITPALGVLTLIAPTVRADWQFVSRPDLSPPLMNISIPAGEDVAKGYIFVTPYRGFIQSEGLDGPEQPGAYIFRDSGDLVWSSIGIMDGWVGNFQVTRWRGEEVLQAFQGTLDSFHGHGYGHPTLLNRHYESIREVRPANHRIISIHEFRVVDEKSALTEIYQPTAIDLSPYGGKPDQQWIADAIIQEFDIATGKLIFEWRSLDHVDPGDSKISLTSGAAFNGINSSVAWDFFHANSVDKDDQGNYLVSARHMSTIYKINGTSGDIIWKLGGKHSDFTTPLELEFAYQHDARFRSRSANDQIEVISFFDNAARSNGHRGGGVDQINDHSSAKFVMLNTSDWTAKLVHSLPSPERLLATSQGNVQLLPNGNIFVNWGQSGAVTEYRASDKAPIFHAYLDSGAIGTGVQSYRGFRFNWTGLPNEAPAIAALQKGDTTTVYVSWNGDTVTSAWRFFSVKGAKKYFLGEVAKESFETAFSFASDAYASADGQVVVFAEALGADARVLSRTEETASTWDIRFTSKRPLPHIGLQKQGDIPADL